MNDERGAGARSGSGRERLLGILAGGLSGLLAALAFPLAGFWWLAWFALVPLLGFAAYTGGHRVLLPFTAYGLVYFTVGLYWLAAVITPLGPFLIAVVLTVLFVLPHAWLLGRLVRRGWSLLLVAPLSFAVFEFIRSFLFTGFAWLYLSHTHADRIAFIQVADLFGAYGLTAVIVLVNATLAVMLAHRLRGHRRYPYLPRVPAIAAVVFVVLYGLVRIDTVEERPGPGVLLVQGSIPQYMKNDAFRPDGVAVSPELRSDRVILRRHLDLTRQGLAMHPEAQLVVWPETMFPYPVMDAQDEESKRIRAAVDRIFARDFRAATGGRAGIVGAEHYTADGDRRNSVFLIDGTGKIAGVYDKVHAVPGGEYIPLRTIAPQSLVDAVGRMVTEAAGFLPDLTEGEDLVLFGAAGVRFAPLVCYEIIYPELGREARDRGADVLLNVTNYGWFPETSNPEQANQIAVLRAVELRRPVVVAANTGVTVVISPRGRVVATDGTWYPEAASGRRSTGLGEARRGFGRAHPKEVAGTVYGRIPLSGSGTLYAVWGDVPWILTGLLLVAGLFLSPRRGRDAANRPEP